MALSTISLLEAAALAQGCFRAPSCTFASQVVPPTRPHLRSPCAVISFLSCWGISLARLHVGRLRGGSWSLLSGSTCLKPCSSGRFAPACCWQLLPVLWPAALRLVASQLDATLDCPVTRFRTAQQSLLAWRMWTVGRDLRLFPQCREAACIVAYCTRVVRQLVGQLNPALPAVALLDTYGWDVDIARMYRLPPLSRLYRCPADYYDHVQDRVSVAPRSVGLHTRRQLQDAFADMPLQLPHWLGLPLQLRPELLPLLGCLAAWFHTKC